MATATKTVTKSIRMQQKDLTEIERLSRQSGKDFSAITNELLREAIKMRKCPGIVFAHEMERSAKIAGSGIEVWEVIAQYKAMDKDEQRLEKAFHWLTEYQLRSALGYYKAYPEEIDRQIELNEMVNEDYVRKNYSHLRVGA